MLGVLQLGLEADHIVERAQCIVLAELDDGMGPSAAVMRVAEADRLHRAEGERVAAALRHHLDRQAALEVGGVALPVLEGGLLAGQQGVDELLVLAS